jgi:hypothetical protein
LLDPQHPDRSEAAYTLGMAWLTGSGVKKNRHTAAQFMEFVLELDPASDAARQVLNELTGSLRNRMSLWQDKRKTDETDAVAKYRVI